MRISPWREREICCVRSSRDCNVPAHYHNYFELAYVIEGSCTQNFNGQLMTVEKGDVFFFDKSLYHAYLPIPGQQFHVINCTFLGVLIAPELADAAHLDELMRHPLLGLDPEQLRLSPADMIYHDDGSLLPIIELMLDEFVARRQGWKSAVRAQLIYLLIALFRRVERKEDPQTDDLLVQRMIAYLEAHFTESCTLTDLAETMRYSTAYLSRRFHAVTGRTFTAYLRRLRVERACRLLLCTDLSVDAIANAVGYTDLKHFHRIFREETNSTPLRYRTQPWVWWHE